MVATNGLSGVLGNLIAGSIIDRGGVDAMLLFCFLSGTVGIFLTFWSVRLRKRKKMLDLPPTGGCISGCKNWRALRGGKGTEYEQRFK